MGSGIPIGLQNIVEDTTPQLGGDLDVNGQVIISTANGNIVFSPDGTGAMVITSANALLFDTGAGRDFLFKTNTGASGRMELVSLFDGTLNTDKGILAIVGTTGIVAFLHGITVTGTTKLGDGGSTNYIDVTNTGNLTFVGSAGMIFGGIYVKDSVATINVDSDIADVLVTQWTTDTDANNCTPAAASNKITITVAGKYLVSFSTTASVSSGSATALFFNGYIDDVIQPNLHLHRTISSTAKGAMSFSSIVDVPSVPVDLDIRANIESSAARDLTVEDAQLNIFQLGG